MILLQTYTQPKSVMAEARKAIEERRQQMNVTFFSVSIF